MLTNEPSQTNPTRCAIYARVSTDQQAEVQFKSCEAQEDRIRVFPASQEGVYTDAVYKGTNLERPALQRLLQDIKEGKLDVVITYKIDRLTRSHRDLHAGNLRTFFGKRCMNGSARFQCVSAPQFMKSYQCLIPIVLWGFKGNAF
jgi:predicted site-specific integrase-resolvase